MKKLTKNMALQLIREARDWALEEAHESSFGCWNLNLYKTSNYAPYIYELWGHSATTEAMISRHYKSVEAALLHMCNDFNENAAVRNKYQTIEEALAPGGAFTVENSCLRMSYRDTQWSEKQYFSYVLNGTLSFEQQEQIRACLEDGMFIPDQVGIYGCEPHKWHDLEESFTTTELPKPDAMTPKRLVSIFLNKRNGWKQKLKPHHPEERPYTIEIAETACKTIAVWASNREEAEEKAENLYDTAIIDLNVYNDFSDRTFECTGVLSEENVDCFNIYE